MEKTNPGPSTTVTISYAGQRLLGAIDTPPEMDGAVLAARLVRNCVLQAVKTYGATVPGEWGPETVGLYDTLRLAAENGQSKLKALSESSAASEAYKAFTTRRTSNLSLASAARIDAALGVIIVAAAANARTVSQLAITAHHTLHHAGVARAGRHGDWVALAKNFPTSLGDVEAWAKRDTEPRIQAFTAALASALRSTLATPHALVLPGKADTGDAGPNTPGSETSESDRRKPAETATGQAERDDDDHAPPASLVGWLRGRADQAGYLSRFGVEGRWERQTKAELTEVCKSVRAALTPSHPDRYFAFFAAVSLATSLPARRASELKLKRNTDIWLDLQLCAVRWYLQRLLDAEQAKALPPEQMEEADLIEVWLPEAAAIVGLELASMRGDAGDLLELITGFTSPEAREAFLERYRAWLRSLNYASLHGVEDARFGRSLAPFFREQAGDVVAAWLNLDFEEVAIGTMYYVRLDRSYLHTQCDLVWLRVGFGPAAKMVLPNLAIGSRQALTDEKFATAFINWGANASAAVQAMTSAITRESLLKAWTDLVHLRLLATITLGGGRGERLSRLTWGTVYAHPRFLLLRDKDTDEYSQVRMVPIVRLLREILDEHVQDLLTFCRRATELGLRVMTPAGRKFSARAPHRVCFYTAVVIDHPDGAYISRSAIDRSVLVALCEKLFGRELNVGRHTLITMSVRNGFEPALIKVMGGHVRGQAEPFSDGQWIAPADALRSLAAAMEWSLRDLCQLRPPRADLGVLALTEFTSGLPAAKAMAPRQASSRSRVLPEPFTSATALAIRLIDYLRYLVASGQGPSDADANKLANLLLIQWVPVADAKRAWELDAPFQQLGPHCTAFIMKREGCNAEIRRPLVGPAALAVNVVELTRTRTPWPAVLDILSAWLRLHLPATPWPIEAAPCAQALDTLVKLWLRIYVPPFLLTSASPRIAAPTATRESLFRLMEDPNKSRVDNEVLIFRKSDSRGGGRVRMRPSPLKDAMAEVRDFADAEAREGENWARMGDVARKLLAIDTSHHLPAATYVEWMVAEAEAWTGSKGGRIKISSAHTYTSNITSALEPLRPDENMREWEDEWFEFFAFLRATVKGETKEQKEAARTTRIVAATRFVRTLAMLGYSIPDELLDAPVARGIDGMRKSAASTLLLESDRQQATRLMSDHFAEGALEAILAPLYCELRWAFAFRSIEVGVLPLDAIDGFLKLVVTTDGFAHLKSRHARRFAAIVQELVDRFSAAALAVARARPNAKWMFLLDNRRDWSLVDEIEDAFGAALKQSTGEPEARPHSARAVLPLAELFPGWEPMLRLFLNGQTTTDECVRFCAALRERGFGALVAVLLKTGHGHPVTFLRYYFALWDLLMSIFAQASLANIPADPRHLVRSHGKTAAAALRQAELRSGSKGTPFDTWAWMTAYVPAASRLPRLTTVVAPSKPHATPRRTKCSPAAAAPLNRQMLYLTLRITLEDETSAADGAKVPTTAAAELEAVYNADHATELRNRHQAGDSPTARRSEVKYLRGPDGQALAISLAQSAPTTLQQFGLALTPMRAGDYVLPAIEAFRATLIRFASCLPPKLGVLTQFKVGRLQSVERARLEDEKVRIFVGDDDRDLGERPRVFVVETRDPRNFVQRARRTANTRALLAAYQLIRSNPGSNAK